MRAAILFPLAAFALAACSDDAPKAEAPADPTVAEGEERAGAARGGFGDGMITRVVVGSVDEAADRLEAALEEKGFTVMSRIDHAANAETVELNMAPATVFIFGKPDVGSRLMQSAPSAALDLPQRMAIYQTPEEVVVAYNDPAYLATRHNITEQDERLEAIGNALSSLAMIAAGEEPGGTAENTDTEEQE